MGSVGFVQSSGAGLSFESGRSVPRLCRDALAPKNVAVRARAAVRMAASGSTPPEKETQPQKPLGFVAAPTSPEDAGEKTEEDPKQTQSFAEKFEAMRNWFARAGGADEKTLTEAEERLTAVEHRMVQELKQKLEVTEEGRLAAMLMLKEAKQETVFLKDAVAAAEKAIADLQAKKKANDQAKQITTKTKQEMEEQQAAILAKMQDKLDASALALNKEITARKEQQQRVKTLEFQMSTNEAKLNNLAGMAKDLEEALQHKSSELTQYKLNATNVDELMSEKKELQSRLAGLEHLVRDREREISTLLKRQNEAEQQILSTKDAAAQARSTLEQETQRNAAMASELASTVKESDLAAAIVNDLAKRLNERTAQLEEAKNEITAMTAQFRDTQSSLQNHTGPPSPGFDATKRDMERVQEELVGLKSKYSQMEAKLRASGREVQALQKSDRLKDSQLERTKMQLLAAEEANTTFRRELAQAGAKVEQLQDVSSIMADIPTLAPKVASTDAYLAQLTRA